MDPDLKSRRIDVLLRWRASIVGSAGPVPSEGDLTKVGNAGTVWPPHVDRATLEPWADTIRFLFEEVALGHANPVGRIPARLRSPRGRPTAGTAATPPPDPPRAPAGDAPGPDGDSLLDRVRRWREQALHDGVPGAGELKPSMLRSIVNRGLRTADDIAGGLPRSLAHLAPGIAAAMRGEAGHRAGRSADGAPPDVDAGPAVADEPGDEAGTDPDIGGPAVDTRLKGLRFVPFRHHAVPRPTERVTVEPTPTGGVALRWPDAATDPAEPSAVVVYRVVSDGHAAPISPDEEDADLIAVTCGLAATDDRPFDTAVRHFAVWRHTGATEAEAAATQPVPHAEGWHVVPPRDVDVHYDHPRVVGSWHRLDGTDVVQVVRTLRRGGRPAPREEAWDGYEEVEDGFKDTRPVPGSDYDYWIRAGVLVDGSYHLSDPVRCRVQIPAAHEPVRDLKLEQHVDQRVDDADGAVVTAFDLSWTPPPAGSVWIYRTEQPPASGLLGEAIAEAALPLAGLHPQNRLTDRPGLVGGRAVIRAVPWPARTHRAYFTPVTLLNDRARVGPTLSESRLGEIAGARIVERTREQVITFEWPPGATSVWLHRRVGRPKDPDHGDVREHGPADREISLDEYERLGGVRVQLDRRGEWVRLVPVLWEDSPTARQGTPVTLEYPGLVRLWYSVGMRRLDGVRVAVAVRVYGHPEDGAPPRFAFVHHRLRLPLSWRDDIDTTRLSLSGPGAGGPDTSWVIQPTTLHPRDSPVWETEVPPAGFVRLCIAEPVSELARFALHDPPVTTLQPALAPDGRPAADAPGPAGTAQRGKRRRWRR